MNKITPADISNPQELIARAKALSVAASLIVCFSGTLATLTRLTTRMDRSGRVLAMEFHSKPW